MTFSNYNKGRFELKKIFLCCLLFSFFLVVIGFDDWWLMNEWRSATHIKYEQTMCTNNESSESFDSSRGDWFPPWRKERAWKGKRYRFFVPRSKMRTELLTTTTTTMTQQTIDNKQQTTTRINWIERKHNDIDTNKTNKPHCTNTKIIVLFCIYWKNKTKQTGKKGNELTNDVKLTN